MECTKIKQMIVKGAVERLLGEAAAENIQDFRCAKEYDVSYTTGSAILSDFEGSNDLDFQDFGDLAASTAPTSIFGPVLPEIFTPKGVPVETLEYFDIFEKDTSYNMAVFRSKANPDVLYALYYQGY